MLGMAAMPSGTAELGLRSAYDPFRSLISSMDEDRMVTRAASSTRDMTNGGTTEVNPCLHPHDVMSPMLDYRVCPLTSSPTCLSGSFVEFDAGFRWRGSCDDEELRNNSTHGYSAAQNHQHQDICFRFPSMPQLHGHRENALPVDQTRLSSTSSSWIDKTNRRQRSDTSVRSSSTTGSTSSFVLNDWSSCHRTRMLPFPPPTEFPSGYSSAMNLEPAQRVTPSASNHYGNESTEHRTSASLTTPEDHKSSERRYVTSANSWTRGIDAADKFYKTHTFPVVTGVKHELPAADVTCMYSGNNYFADYRCSGRDVTPPGTNCKPDALTAAYSCGTPDIVDDVQRALGNPANDIYISKQRELVTSDRWSLPADHSVISLKMTSSTSVGKTRTRDKYRTVYAEPQRIELEAEYQSTTYVSAQRKADIALSVGLSERQVKIWFQNRRAKDRRSERKKRSVITGNTATETPIVADKYASPETVNGSSEFSTSASTSPPPIELPVSCADMRRFGYYGERNNSPGNSDSAPMIGSIEAPPPHRLTFKDNESLSANTHQLQQQHHHQYYA